MFMLLVFLGVIVYTFRPGSRSLHRETARIPFRHDDKPAASDAPDRTEPFKEARQ
jgi:cytochrome c oxidase cbb3-type subunit 4